MSGPICLNSVDGSVCRNLLAESAKMRRNHLIDLTDDVNSGAEGAVREAALPASEIRSRSPASVPALNCISNDLSLRQKHRGVPHNSDGSDGTSYPLTETYTLPVAQVTCRVAHVPGFYFGDLYAPSGRHVCYTLHSGCSYAEAVFSPAAASLEMLRVHMEIIATTYRSTIFKSYAFSLCSHLCIYVSI